MQCLVLAGGLGTRMQALSQGKPKALLPVGNLSFIEFQLCWLRKMGMTEVIMSLGHKSEEIENAIKNSQVRKQFPSVVFCYDGPELRGTGGAIWQAMDLLKEDFFVTYGDTILFLDARKMFEHHTASGKRLTLGVLRNDNIGDKSNIKVTGGIPFYDKHHPTAEMNFIDYGIMVINKGFFQFRTKNEKFDLADFMHKATAEKLASCFETHEMFQEIGSPDGYRRFDQFMEEYHYDLSEIYMQKIGLKP